MSKPTKPTKDIGLFVVFLTALFLATLWCFFSGYWPVGILLVVIGLAASESDSGGGDCDPCMGG